MGQPGGSVNDHAARALSQEGFNLVFHRQPDASEVNGDHPVKIFAALFGDGSEVADDAGVVEGDVEPAVVGGHRGEQPTDIVFLGDVGHDGQGVAASQRDVARRGFDFRRASAGQRHFGAFAGIGQRGGAADACAAAAHQHDFVRQTARRFMSWSCSINHRIDTW